MRSLPGLSYRRLSRDGHRQFRGRYTYPFTADVGRGTLGSWRDRHEGGFRRFGATFRRGLRWAIGGFVAGLEHSLGRPLRRRKPGPPAGRKRKRR